MSFSISSEFLEKLRDIHRKYPVRVFINGVRGLTELPGTCRAYAEHGFNAGRGCPQPAGHHGNHGVKP
jgi:hypothetical protein